MGREQVPPGDPRRVDEAFQGVCMGDFLLVDTPRAFLSQGNNAVLATGDGRGDPLEAC